MYFQNVSEAKPDPIFGLVGAFQKDPRKNKVDLMVGIYKDDHLKAQVFPSLQQAFKLIEEQDLVADYLKIDGHSEMLKSLGKVVFGKTQWELSEDRIYAAHTTGGTAALRIAAEFLAREVGKTIYIPNHTWPNHNLVFERAGCIVETYPYYSDIKKSFDLHECLFFLSKLEAKSIVLFHACCHNPTGCDPTLDDWAKISKLMKERSLFPFFDFAYQGLGEGLEADAQGVLRFFQDGHEMIIAYSCSKNFSMYGQRVGALFAITDSPETQLKVGSQIKRVIRALYSNPPAHGARAVSCVLKSPELTILWQKDLSDVRLRIGTMRENFIELLHKKIPSMNIDPLKRHKGMFSFVDINKNQVKRLIDEFGIYLTDNGRISLTGLTTKNIEYVVDSIGSVCENR